MGFFTRWFANWGLGVQKKELQAFVDGLASMDGPEVGFIVVVATHLRNNLEDSGYRLMDPLVDYPADPTVVFRLRRLIREYQRSKQPTDAAGVMVWLHTMRVGGRHELRPLARDMWRQLSRGFPHAEDSAFEILKMTLKPPRIDGFYNFPSGLTPDPI